MSEQKQHESPKHEEKHDSKQKSPTGPEVPGLHPQPPAGEPLQPPMKSPAEESEKI
ncbi:MAG TPA: hypothetical protein VGF49_06165 [Candidatus Solibacter sp.]|jgi:hypothetical protein